MHTFWNGLISNMYECVLRHEHSGSRPWPRCPWARVVTWHHVTSCEPWPTYEVEVSVSNLLNKWNVSADRRSEKVRDTTWQQSAMAWHCLLNQGKGVRVWRRAGTAPHKCDGQRDIRLAMRYDKRWWIRNQTPIWLVTLSVFNNFITVITGRKFC